MEIKTEIKKLEKSQVEIIGQIAAVDFASFEKEAIAEIGKDVELPGFRKGHVPENVLLKHIPEIKILEEMAEHAIMKAYPEILEKEKIDAIGRPEITLTKLAKGNPLEFKILTTVLPEVTLADYKKIAKDAPKEETPSVTDEDIDKTIMDVRKMRAQKEKAATGEVATAEKKDTPAEIPEADLPPLDDTFVKTLGSFNDVEDFKTKIRENMRLEKEQQTKEKRRLKIVETLIEESKIELPELLAQAELDKMLYRLKTDVQNIGFDFDTYLKQIQKTEEDIRTEWLPEAEKRSKLQLIIEKIAETENIRPSDADIEHELGHLLEQYKDADKIRARAYIESTLTTEKVFQFLESQ